MVVLTSGSGLQHTVLDGSVLLAAPIALAAGLISFFSPCVLPLVPSYFAYATGLSGADVVNGRAGRRRLMTGASLFCLGFGAVFVALGVGAGSLGRLTAAHTDSLTRAAGVLSILLGLVYLGVLRWRLPAVRIRWFPGVGVAIAPVLGALFAAIWLPCVGPVLGVILTMAYNSGSAARGGTLLAIYTVGLSLPFLIAALVWSRAISALKRVARHGGRIRVAAGAMLVVIGVAMVLGWWTYGMQWMQIRTAGFAI